MEPCTDAMKGIEGAGGVSVAAGDIDGDGRDTSSSRRPATRPARADDAGNGRR
jgi:hypothetical protein